MQEGLTQVAAQKSPSGETSFLEVPPGKGALVLLKFYGHDFFSDMYLLVCCLTVYLLLDCCWI